MPDHSIDFPLTAQEARHSMTLWLSGNTGMSLVDWLDHRFWAHQTGLDVATAADRWMVFKGTFERSLAEHIAGVNHG
ncbi:putative protein OS=Castellaniella sp OX=1955812 GN=EPN31_14085 PE=4 SV=1 [Castellaniella denitrificans]